MLEFIQGWLGVTQVWLSESLGLVLYGLVYFGLVQTKLAVEEFFGLGLGFIQDRLEVIWVWIGVD